MVILGNIKKTKERNHLESTINKFSRISSFWNKFDLSSIIFMRERQQIHRLYEWLLTRVLIKFGINILYQQRNMNIIIKYKNILIKKDGSNKPIIEILLNYYQEIKPYISISHSNQEIFVAFSFEDIGIDHELFTQNLNYFKRKFTSEEEYSKIAHFLKNLKSSFDDIILTIIWSIKEATLKLQGNLNISYLPKIEIKVNQNNIISKIPNQDKKYTNLLDVYDNSVLVISI
ncbi:MAG: 4'-phosphopantetheinyl transferase family protein [Promethearchaeota archaeon]